MAPAASVVALLGLIACSPGPSPVLVGEIDAKAVSASRFNLGPFPPDAPADQDPSAAATDSGAAADVTDTSATSSGRAGQIIVRVNDEERAVPVGTNRSFAVQELPTGEVEISVDLNHITGTLTLHEVQPGEVIAVAISIDDDRFQIRVVRREVPAADAEYLDTHSGDIVIDGKHTVYYLDPGIYTGDIIVRGHHVTLIGARDEACDGDGGTALRGDLSIRGHHVRVINVDLQGSAHVAGHHLRVYGSCANAMRSSLRGDDFEWE